MQRFLSQNLPDHLFYGTFRLEFKCDGPYWILTYSSAWNVNAGDIDFHIMLPFALVIDKFAKRSSLGLKVTQPIKISWKSSKQISNHRCLVARAFSLRMFT